MYKLLIVDDEPLICVGIQSMLDWNSLNIEIVGPARNGEQAAEIIAEHMPDIVISDIKMPLKDGLQLAKECSQKYGRLPVFIMLTNYEDFDFIRQALQTHVVDYLIKIELDEANLYKAICTAIETVNQFKTVQLPTKQALVRSNMQALRDKFFIRLFNNLFDNETMYYAQKNDLDIDLQASGFLIGNCEITSPAASSSTLQDQLSLYSSASQLIRDTLSKFLRCYVVPLDMWHLTIVFCLEESALQDYHSLIRKALKKTIAMLHNYLKVSLHVALGLMVPDGRKIYMSYKQAQLCFHRITEAEPIIFCGAAESDAKDEPFSDMKNIRKGIRKAFQELDNTALNEALTQIADAFIKHPDHSLQALDTACNILYMTISLLPEGEALLEQIFNDEPESYRVLYQSQDVESIAAWVKRLRDGCNELLHSGQQSYKQHVVENVKNYIQENIGKHLSLHEVAAVFNLNPSYLSHLFSKYSDEGFVEYITSIRIDSAKQLLISGEHRVYEVGEKLGFENSFYFSRVFKKVAGVSPREYIQKNEGLQKR
jgi:two-component system response regulator YesN